MKKFIVLGLSVVALAACGVKPGNVDAPDGKENKYPHTYPDMRTDPSPRGGPGALTFPSGP